MRAEIESALRYPIPLRLRHIIQFLAVYSARDYTIDNSCIKIIACTHSTYDLYLIGQIVLFTRLVKNRDLATTLGTDEIGTVEFYFLFVNTLGIGQIIEIIEILGRATHNIGELKILYYRLTQFNTFGNMIFPEINIVIEDCASLASILQECFCLAAQYRVEHKI